MLIGERIRAIREVKNLSQLDIEKRSGLLRMYVSRVENNHTVPSFETLERFARALEVPLYQFFYEGKKSPELPPLLRGKAADHAGQGESRQEARDWERFRQRRQDRLFDLLTNVFQIDRLALRDPSV